jgi:hypothetical protein
MKEEPEPGKLKKSPLLEAVVRERPVKTQDAGKA